MARPRRGNRSQENRKRRQRAREFKRGKATIARQREAVEAIAKARVEGQVATTKPRRLLTGSRATGGEAETRQITSVSRKGQPRPKITVGKLEKRDYLGRVSSSWLSTIGYIFSKQRGLFNTLKSPKLYQIFEMPFELFEEWYYASSKGTFWNEKIRDQYTIE